MDIVHSKLTEPYYRVIQYSVFNQSTRQFHRHIQLLPLSQDLFTALQHLYPSIDSLFTGYIASYIYSSQELFSLLQTNLSHFTITIHSSYYQQVVGIPQGSILSIPLCNLYLRAFEKAQFSSFLSSSSPSLQIIRFVDDFLFISSSRSILQAITVSHSLFYSHFCRK